MSLPAYDDLPELDGLPLPHAWDVWGRLDNLGSLNLIDRAAVLRGLAVARRGHRISLSLPLNEPGPPLFGRREVTQGLVQQDRNSWDDRLDSFHPQSSSQWDGFGHYRCREYGYWTGVTSEPAEHGDRLGIEHWADGIVTRGVLVDVPRHRARTGRPYDPMSGEAIDAPEVEEILKAQRVEPLPGDVLCVRLGWTAAYRALSPDQRVELASERTPTVHSGLAGSEAMARLLWDRHVAAVTADNPSVEAAPGDPTVGSLHRRLLPLLGIVMGELFDFDELAADCAAEGSWDFTFIGVPHRMPGGLGSPANAVGVR
ncbi:cyclase family protein [Acrocarpospora catenulata]|uniref:cyclase family protein n=1 Tax=Acrocarpospora catenulata TaxID=2836182 RepID=UPI001BD9BC17|nr:cyclase family protein [Acrocarpospora catenulata]